VIRLSAREFVELSHVMHNYPATTSAVDVTGPGLLLRLNERGMLAEYQLGEFYPTRFGLLAYYTELARRQSKQDKL
jgi:hypothetical protein